MIKSWADRRTRDLFFTGRTRGFPPEITRRAIRKLEYINLAAELFDLASPPGNRLHSLHGDRDGQFAIAINGQWRICFTFLDGDAYDVEITDYH